MDEISPICLLFFRNKPEPKISKITGGLINSTFKIEFENNPSYILQKINPSIFIDPDALMQNIQKISTHQKKTLYPLEILEPIVSINGQLVEKDDLGNYWRAFPFIEKTNVYHCISSAEQAFEAAKSFGLFVKYLEKFDVKLLHQTIKHFHDLENRMELFEKVLKKVDAVVRNKAKDEIHSILALKTSLHFDFENMPLRVVHSDTKISNVLFDENGGKGVCVIDLDTAMPGYVIFDFGDIVRTMCCTASEEETNLDKVEIDSTLFEAVTKGFLGATNKMLSDIEKKHFLDGAVYIIFEQAVRFLTDYLQGDKYYATNYADQNLDRTKNQLKLIESLLDKKDSLELITSELF